MPANEHRGSDEAFNLSSNDDEQNTHSRPRTMMEDMTYPDTLLQMFLDAVFKLWYQIQRISTFVMVELGGYEIFDRVALWCVRNPHIAICFLAAGLVLLLPFLIIFGFIVATMVMTFSGILVLEGTLLTIISMIFFGCLGGLAIVLVLFAVIAVAAYFGFQHIYDFYGGMEKHKDALRRFVQSQQRSKQSGQSETVLNRNADIDSNSNAVRAELCVQ